MILFLFTKLDMPQFSPLWFINLISWTLGIISFVVWYVQTISFPMIVRLLFSRTLLTQETRSSYKE